jgi:hypothetical protein
MRTPIPPTAAASAFDALAAQAAQLNTSIEKLLDERILPEFSVPAAVSAARLTRRAAAGLRAAAAACDEEQP